MLDIRFIRENAELVAKKSKQKGYEVDIQKLIKLDDDRKAKLFDIEAVSSKRNELAEKWEQGKPNPEQIEEGRKLRGQQEELEIQIEPIKQGLKDLIRSVPNIFPDDTPLGGEESNKEIKRWGDTSDKDFEIVDHLTWADSQERELLDFERGAKVAGNKFYYVEGSLVELELALVQFGIQAAKEFEMDGRHRFRPMLVPHLVNTEILEGAGFSAKGEERQIYKIEGEELNLIATAEIPLTGFHANEQMFRIPRFYVGFSPSYRVEAGAYGKHSKGLYRVHQFNKLELYVFCEGNLETSEKWHEKMVDLEEKFCQALGIPYRVVRIAAGDLGAPAYKKFDIEYWSPVDKTYRELMSCSNVTDYQARRLNIRYKENGEVKGFVHTLNGTLAATSRLMIAIIENYQQADGTVKVPDALQPYMRGQTTL